MAYGTIINGTLLQIFLAAFCIAIGLYGFAAAAEGFTKRKLVLLERLLYLVSAILVIFPLTVTRLIGVVVFAFPFFLDHKEAIFQRLGLGDKKSQEF